MNTSLTKLHVRAAELGWRCHATQWSGHSAHYTFECAKGHRFDRQGGAFLRCALMAGKSRCDACEADDIKQRWLANVAQRGGILLGTFTGLLERYRLRCASGHEWEAQGRKISEGSWCRRCQHAQMRDASLLVRLTDTAAAHGLQLLSTQWLGATSSYRFQCANGHQFDRQAQVITRGSTRCLQCVRDELAQRFADTLRECGFVCLDLPISGATGRHRFQCGAGHVWETRASKILEGSGCPKCSNARVAEMNKHADGLDRLQRAASEHGGQCLTDIYSGVLASYEWQCANGHRWSGTGATVLRGIWCRACAARRHGDALTDPNGLVRIQAAAASRGGRCLDTEYTGVNNKYGFRCAEGHEWQATGSAIMGGVWCRSCGVKTGAEARRIDDGLKQIQAAAAAHGGEVIGSAYLGTSGRYTFRCDRGHQWQTRGSRVLSGTWCPHCARLGRRHTLEDMQRIAQERGRRCVSTEYVGAKERLRWECDRGHVWDANADSVLNQQTWCPNCAILTRTKKQHLRQRYDYERDA